MFDLREYRRLAQEALAFGVSSQETKMVVEGLASVTDQELALFERGFPPKHGAQPKDGAQDQDQETERS